MSGMLNRNSYVGYIIVKCAPDDVESPALNGLALRVLEIEGRQLELKRVSETTWKHDGVVEIPPVTDQLSIAAFSIVAGDIGCVSLTKQVWNEIQDNNASQKDLDLDFETKDAGLTLSLSFRVYVPNLDEVSQLISTRNRMTENPAFMQAFLLSLKDDDPLKADGLNLCGDEFLRAFLISGNYGYSSKAITAYEQAAGCLSAGDPRLGMFLKDVGAGYQERYKRFGQIDDLQKAIAAWRNAVAITAEEHADFPNLLGKLGASLSIRFEHTGDLNDIVEAIRNQERAIKLIPEEHTELPTLLSTLGNAFSRRFERTGNLDDIVQAIQNQQRAVHITPDEHTDRPSFLSNLGNSFLARFENTGDLEDISEAIRNLQRAVQLTTGRDPNLPFRLSNLGTSFSRRFEHTGDLDDISEAIRIQQRSVQLTRDDAALPVLFTNLGHSLSCRFKRTGDPNDISEAIRNQRYAIQLTPVNHPNRPSRLNNLGNLFLQQFKRSGHLEDISEAIRNIQLAVQLTPDSDGHADLPIWLNNLGNSFLYRFEHTGDMDNISEAIRHQQRAVQLTPVGHADLPGRLNSLGNSFLRRFEHTGDLEDVSEAIQNQQHAVQLTTERHADLPALLNNLGNSLSRRSNRRTGDLEDISEAIRNLQRAVQLTPDGHADLPALRNNLGNSFVDRFELTKDIKDISEAIRILQHAIEDAPDKHSLLPALLNNLGNSFFARFEHTEDIEDISEAIRIRQRAIQLAPEEHADLPVLLSNLGNSFSSRFKHTRDLKDLSEGIRNIQCAVQLTPKEHAYVATLLKNLGTTFHMRFIHTGDSEFLSEAVLNYRLSATSPTGPPSDRLQAAQQWATLSRHTLFESLQLLEAHACIIQLLSLISGLENTVQRRHESLVKSSQLSIAASATALSLARPDKALEWLMEGRCIVWNQLNQLRTPVDELRAHSPAHAQRLTILTKALENAGLRTDSRSTRMESLSMEDKISLEEQAAKHIKLAKEWDLLLAEIRDISDFDPDFLRPKRCVDIMRRLPNKGTVVIVNIHSDRCDALALRAGATDPMHIPLSKFCYQEAERLARGLRSSLLRYGVRIGVPLGETDSPPNVNLDEVLRVLWSDIVWPILEELDISAADSPAELTRIWWCPTGPLAFLPIHAAGIYVEGKGVPKQCLSDFAVSSYIPTLNILFETPTSVKKSGDSAPTGLLIVSQPNTPGKSAIPYVKEEVEKIQRQLQRRGISSVTLNDQNGTVNGLLKSMELFPSIHLACHAVQDITKPLKSSIFLHDGPLELLEIMKKNLTHSDFAFLSACQTSKGVENLSEEVVHLASGMLAAGYRSVVGTMWSIFDLHGPDMAEFFYKSLLDDATNEGPKVDGTRAARALHHATRRFREKLAGSPDSLLAWVPYIHIGI